MNVIIKRKTGQIYLTNFTLFAYTAGITFDDSIPNYLNYSAGINNSSSIVNARTMFN
jgi:hypothetical protein